MHADSSEFGRRYRRLVRRAGASASETRRSLSDWHWRLKGSPWRASEQVSESEASETPLLVRDDRLRGVPGLRVGSKKSVSDVRFQQVPPVAAGGTHGNLARGRSRRAQGRKPEDPKVPTESEKTSRAIVARRAARQAGGREQRACGGLLADDRRSVLQKPEPFTRQRWMRC